MLNVFPKQRMKIKILLFVLNNLQRNKYNRLQQKTNNGPLNYITFEPSCTHINILVPVPLGYLFALFWCYLGHICIIFYATLASKLNQLMPEILLLIVLFGTNIVSNIRIRALKHI